jgi:DNA helicase-2/ATP-dependent DNA helicase PcrA
VPWDDDLEGTARDIAATPDSPLRVMAGPGTGKSFALKRRVARLLEEGIPPRRVLAVTFTRNAARLLKDDLDALGSPGADAVQAGTLHSYCFALLNRDEVLQNLGRSPRPIVTFAKSRSLQYEAAPMLADIRRQGVFGGQREATKRVWAFEAAWARLESDQPGWPADPTDRAFHDSLGAWLRFHRAMLIGEVVPEALRYLRNNPAADALTAFDHVLVDEYQDLNRAEQDLVDLLGAGGSTSLVGDVDQSIYQFRHANPEGIEDFDTRHPGTHDEVLDECRRCPTSVVSMADHLIRENHVGDAVPRLRPKPGNPVGEVAVVQWSSQEEEVAGIAQAVQNLVRVEHYLPQDILVLTPRRMIGYRIRNRLRAAAIPVHSFYHEEALEARTAQRAFNLLTLLAVPDDPIALRWRLGDGHASWNASRYERLMHACEASGNTPFDTLTAAAAGAVSSAGIEDLVLRFGVLRRELDGLTGLSLPELVDHLFPDGDDDFSALRESALLGIEALDSAADLHDRIRGQITQPDMPESGEFVRIMSLHKSKGLTSKAVIVNACIEGLIPFRDDDEPIAEQQRTLAEQRRLFYVAMTRCTERLVLSSFTSVDRRLALQIGAVLGPGGGRWARCLASRFLNELGPDAPHAIRGSAWPLARGQT